jgi:hypothetical protein
LQFRATQGSAPSDTRPRTTEDIAFLVGEEAFQKYSGGFVTMRVPVIEFDGIDVDQVPITEPLRVVEEGLGRAIVSDGVPIAPIDIVVIMKLIAGRTQDMADIEAIIASGADRNLLKAAVERVLPNHVGRLETLFGNVDRDR